MQSGAFQLISTNIIIIRMMDISEAALWISGIAARSRVCPTPIPIGTEKKVLQAIDRSF
jgi:hypothetical protein